MRKHTSQSKRSSRRSGPLTETLEPRELFSTYMVTNLADHGTGSLRQAVLNANAHVGTDTINFASNVKGTITLTTGELNVTDSVTINGPGASLLAVSGNNSSRVFDITKSSATVTINGLKIENGNPGINFGGGVRNYGKLTLNNDIIYKNVAASALVGGVYGGGAGLMNFGTATLNNVSVTNNTAYGHDDSGYDGGGGIYNRGTLNLNNSRLTANTIALSASAPYNAEISGGGLFNGLATANVTNTSISGNTASITDTIMTQATCLGGGVSNDGVLTLKASTVNNNMTFNNDPLGSSDGGGIYNDGQAKILNCTLANNIAGQTTSVGAGGNGGAFASEGGTVTMINCTVSNNIATGLCGGLYVNGGLFRVGNTIVDGNFDEQEGGPYMLQDVIEFHGTLVSFGHNLIGSSDDTAWTNSDQVGTAAKPLGAKLGALAFNGGPTETMAITFASLAANEGSNSLAAQYGLTTDQRGLARVSAGFCDVGAFEFQF